MRNHCYNSCQPDECSEPHLSPTEFCSGLTEHIEHVQPQSYLGSQLYRCLGNVDFVCCPLLCMMAPRRRLGQELSKVVHSNVKLLSARREAMYDPASGTWEHFASMSLPVLAFVGFLCLKSYFIVILICSSMVNYEVEHVFMFIFIFIGRSCFLFINLPVYVFCIFPVCFLFIRILYILQMEILCWSYHMTEACLLTFQMVIVLNRSLAICQFY